MLKALRSSVMAKFAKSQSNHNKKAASPAAARDESHCLYNHSKIREGDDFEGKRWLQEQAAPPDSSMSTHHEGLAITESVDQSDECCSCLSGSTSIFDEIFELNASLRFEAITAINGETAIESVRFAKLKKSISQALGKAVLYDAANSPVSAGMQLKDASCAADGLVCCIVTLRKLRKCKKSIKRSSFTPGQYKKITRMVISKSLAQHHGDEKVDSMLYLLKQFKDAVLTDSSQSMQLELCHDLVDHFEYFTIEAALSSKKSALRISRKVSKSFLPPSEPNANPHDPAVDGSEAPCPSSSSLRHLPP
jgi:hypothetical protein